jgi:hypothetical protein
MHEKILKDTLPVFTVAAMASATSQLKLFWLLLDRKTVVER